MYSKTIFTVVALGAVASAFDLPDNLRQIYESHISGDCQNPLSDAFEGGAQYCGDIPNVIFLKGSDGNYDNMDVDCDGANNSAGACANNPSGQGQTAFQDTVQSFGIDDLDANIHPYVVFGNEGASPSFAPQDFGMEPLSIVAVVCNDQVFYGVWGDTNGFTSTGESSISLAQLCFPNDGLTGDNGHDQKDVLYIGFTGSDAVPGANANWSAGSTEEFESSIKDLGDSLVASLPAQRNGLHHWEKFYMEA